VFYTIKKTDGDTMNRQQFTLCGIIIIACMGAIFAWSITRGNAILPIVAVILGITALYLCKSRVDEIIEDERDYKIAEKASRVALQIFTVSLVVIGISLRALSQNGHPEMAQVGLTLVFAACALLMLYSVLYGYYNRKYGA